MLPATVNLLGFLAPSVLPAASRVWALRPRLVTGTVAVVNPLVLAQVEVNPTSEGFPGGPMAQKLLNWAGQLGLWGSLLSILVGACIWGVSQQFGNGFQTGKGKVLVGAGAIGAVITGLGAIIVNTLFTAARG